MFVAVFLLFFCCCCGFYFIFFLGGGGGLFCFVVVVFLLFFLVSAIDALDLVRNTKRNSEQTDYVHIRERGAANRV